MDDLKMVDLYNQYRSIKSEIDEAMQEVINSTAFINGPQVKEFSANLARYLNAKYIIPCANGTDALQIALMALNLQPGDEVITPDFTFVATAEVIALLKLKPVIVDVDPYTYTINPRLLKNAITSKTKAIIPVHLFGLCAPMEEIYQVAHEYDLSVIEDTAQAMGADYNGETMQGKAGTLGTMGCTSFFPSKNLGCFGDGGAIITNSESLAENARCIANHGAKIKYHNDEVGVNSRLDTLQAAILNVKLNYLDSYNKARQKAADYYTEQLTNIDELDLPVTPSYSNHVYHQYTLKFKGDRDKLKKYLAEKGIPSMIYYPVPVHIQKAYATEGNYQITNQLAKTVISLPMHTELTEDQQDYICQEIKSFLRK